MGLYQQLEEKWYQLLDALQAKGVPIYDIVTPIENAGIPTLPLTAGALLLLIALTALLLLPGAATATLTVTATSNGAPLEGAAITAGDTTATTDAQGKATLKLAPGNHTITAEKQGCETLEKEAAAPGEAAIDLLCMGTPSAGACIEISTELETTVLRVNGAPPRECEVRVHPAYDLTQTLPTGWRVDASGTLQMATPQESCPKPDDNIEISCKDARYTATLKDFLKAAQTQNTLDMQEKKRDTEFKQQDKEEAGIPAEIIGFTADAATGATVNTVPITVTVASSDGTPLEGIVVKAVDDNGYTLNTGLAQEAEAGTSSAGIAQLVLPAGTSFRVAATDPRGAHTPIITDKYAAAAQLQVAIKLAAGFATKVYVKEKDRQTPIVGAILSVTDGGQAISAPVGTNAAGLAVLSLLQGKGYTVQASHSEYENAEATVKGGEDATIYLAPLDPTKMGAALITISNEHGTKDRMPGVLVQLLNENGLYLQGVTGADGSAFFPKATAGTYKVRAVPPGDSTAQELGDIEVKASETAQKAFDAMPMQVTIRVKPVVELEDGKQVPKQKVRVELWNSAYEELAATKDTDFTRRSDFTVDRGTTAYFVAAYDEGGSKWGPTTTTPQTFLCDAEVPIVLKQAPEDTQVTMEVRDKAGQRADNLGPAGEYDAFVSVALPAYTKGNGYDKTTVEVYAGEPGSLASAGKTPIVIGSLSLTDVAVQEPKATALVKADEYITAPGGADYDDPSKYVSVSLGEYKPTGWYTMRVPLYVRALAAEGKATLHYRATWEEKGKKVDSGWKTLETRILTGAEGGLWGVDNPVFYAYYAGFADSVEGAPQKSISVTQGSTFYLKVRAKAKANAGTWEIPLTTVPAISEMTAFEGTVGEAQMPLTAAKNWVVTGSGLFAVKTDDEVSATVTLRATKPGKASLGVFSDTANILTYTVMEVGVLEKATSVAGVTATLSMNSTMSPEGTFDPAKDTLPANNKQFTLKFTFTASEARTLKIRARPTTEGVTLGGKAQYDGELAVAKGMTKLDVYGDGKAFTDGTMGVYIAEKGAEYGEPWATITYGPVDYEVSVGAYEGSSAAAYVNERVDRLAAAVKRTTSKGEEKQGRGVLYEDAATITYNGAAHKAFYSDSEGVFALDVTEKLGTTKPVTVEAKSPKFGTITRDYSVGGLAFWPGYRTLPEGKGVNINQNALSYVNITNTHPKDAALRLALPSRKGWEIKANVTIRAPDGAMTEEKETADSFSIPSRHTANITLTITPTGVECVGDGNEAIEIAKFSSDQLKQDEAFKLSLQCTGQKQTVSTRTEIASYVRRDPTPPESVDKWACNPGNEKFAYVCDSEQLASAILDAANDLLSSDEEISHVYSYAFANDRLSAVELRQVFSDQGRFEEIGGVITTQESAATMASADVIMPTALGCGRWDITLERVNEQKDVLVTAVKQATAADWCDPASWQYTMGLLNYDKSLRPERGMYASFEAGDSQAADLIAAIRFSHDPLGNAVNEGLALSYDKADEPAGVVSALTAGEPATWMKYVECDLQHSADCPKFAADALKTSGEKAVGFFDIDEYGDVKMGMVYNRSRVVDEEGGFINGLKRLRTAFATRLLEYWTKGELGGKAGVTASAWSKKATNSEMVYHPEKDDTTAIVTLVGPTITTAKVIGTGLDALDIGQAFNEQLTATTKVQVAIELATEGAQQDMPYCVVGNLLPNGKITGEHMCDPNAAVSVPPAYTFLCDHDVDAGDGLKQVSVFCVDSEGLPSERKVKTIKLDTTGIELLQELVTPIYIGSSDATALTRLMPKALVRDRFGEPTKCWLASTTTGLKTEGEEEQGGAEMCNGPAVTNADGSKTIPFEGKDSNKNDAVDDGCCSIVIPPGSGTGDYQYFNVAEVQCTSPNILEEDKFVPAALKCRDTVGHIATLGTIQFFKWSHSAPVFAMFDDFAFATTKYEKITEEGVSHYEYSGKKTNGDANAELHFYGTGLAETVYGRYYEVVDGRDTAFSADTENNADTFHYEVDVSDDDGIASCESTVKLTTQAWSKSGDKVTPSSSLKPTVEAVKPAVKCEAPRYVDGNKEVLVSCPMELKEGVNEVTITCTDVTGKSTSIKHTYTRDETPPVMVWKADVKKTVKITPWGYAADDESWVNSPDVWFTVADDYTNIDQCIAELDLKQPTDTVWAYQCTPLGTGMARGDKREVHCTLSDTVTGAKFDMPTLLVNFDNGWLKLYCTDKVGNMMLPKPDDDYAVGKMDWSGPSTTEFYNDVLQACKMMRNGASASDIERRGWIDLGVDGAVGVSDEYAGFGSSQMDEDGVLKVVRYSSGDAIDKGEVTNKYNDNKPSGVWPRPSCASTAVCMGAIDAVSAVFTGGSAEKAVNEGVAQAKAEARTVVKDVAKETTKDVSKTVAKDVSKKIGSQITAALWKQFKKMFVFSMAKMLPVRLARLVVGASVRGFYEGTGWGMAEISSRFADAANARLSEDFGCGDCDYAESGVWGMVWEGVVSFVPFGDALQIAVPDDFQLMYYGPTIESGKTYVIAAQARRIDIGGIKISGCDQCMDYLSKCVASCRDYACYVTVLPEKQS